MCLLLFYGFWESVKDNRPLDGEWGRTNWRLSLNEALRGLVSFPRLIFAINLWSRVTFYLLLTDLQYAGPCRLLSPAGRRTACAHFMSVFFVLLLDPAASPSTEPIGREWERAVNAWPRLPFSSPTSSPHRCRTVTCSMKKLQPAVRSCCRCCKPMASFLSVRMGLQQCAREPRHVCSLQWGCMQMCAHAGRIGRGEQKQ